MRIVKDGETCERYESTCETLASLFEADAQVSPDAEAAIRAHASECAPCAGALETAAMLHRTRAALEVPEPDPSYWVSFSERLEARLRQQPGGGRASRLRPWAVRAGLAVAASAALVVGGLAVRHARRTPSTALPAEAELLQRLDEAPGEPVTEALDEIAPLDFEAALDDLADAEDLLPGEGAPDDDSAYDLFFELGDEDRDQLLKETRGEIG